MGVWKWLCFSYERENYKGAEVLKIFYGDFFSLSGFVAKCVCSGLMFCTTSNSCAEELKRDIEVWHFKIPVGDVKK